jgi:hypothetical protein
MDEIWLKTKEVAELDDVTERAIRKRCLKGKYLIQKIKSRRGKEMYLILLSSSPKETQQKYHSKKQREQTVKVEKINLHNIEINLKKASIELIESGIDKKTILELIINSTQKINEIIGVINKQGLGKNTSDRCLGQDLLGTRREQIKSNNDG